MNESWLTANPFMKQRLSDRTRLEHMLNAAGVVLTAYQQLGTVPIGDGDIRITALLRGLRL